jgi:protein-disulfide isomerase
MAELTIPVHDSDHVRGARTAPATLVMYGDYECPYTRLAYRAVQRVLADESDAQALPQPLPLRFVFRHFPLIGIHPHAEHASEAAEATAAQGGEGTFWAMHDALFAHQHALEDADLVRYAQELGLDAERLAREVGAHTHARRIQADVRSGLASGVQGTPTLYFNGQLHTGGYDEASLRATLARLAAGGFQAS